MAMVVVVHINSRSMGGWTLNEHHINRFNPVYYVIKSETPVQIIRQYTGMPTE